MTFEKLLLGLALDSVWFFQEKNVTHHIQLIETQTLAQYLGTAWTCKDQDVLYDYTKYRI